MVFRVFRQFRVIRVIRELHVEILTDLVFRGSPTSMSVPPAVAGGWSTCQYRLR
jgi:hypothetical protein